MAGELLPRGVNALSAVRDPAVSDPAMRGPSEVVRLTLRPYEPNDLPTLHALDVECFELPFRFSRRTLKRFVDDPCGFTRVALVGGEIAGFLVVHLLRSQDEDFGYVVTLDVGREQRRAGLGLRLMREAESLALSRGARRMVLHVFSGNTGARRFYGRAGYEELGRVADFYGVGKDALLLAKRLGG